ncbi:MAG: hypothetical protein ABIH34_07270, partial [Nanoarchaeota archaeon]
YLSYVYPGEDLECPLPDCEITYRSLDRDFNLFFLGELGLGGVLRDDISSAERRIFAIATSWEGKGIYNVLHQPEEDGIALDTYCIVGLLTENEVMAQTVLETYNDGHWLSDDYYQGESSFRRLADESWCVRLLLATSPGTDEPVDMIVEETLILHESPVSDLAKMIGTLHTLFVLHDAKDARLSLYQDYVYQHIPLIEEDTLTLANVMDALLQTGFPKEKLSSVQKDLVSRQHEEGFWYANPDEEKNAHVFTTFRAVSALARYDAS